LPKRDRRYETGSAARRFNLILRSPTTQRILAQTVPGIDFDEMQAMGKLGIVNLSLHKTRMTNQARRFFGALFIDLIKESIGRKQKNRSAPTYLLIDEFSHFVSYDTLEALAEFRGMGARPILVHQRLDQLLMKDGDPRLMRAVLAIPNKLIFGGGLVDDQLQLARQAFSAWMDPKKVKHEDWQTKFRPFLKMVEVEARHSSEGAMGSESSGDSECRSSTAISASSKTSSRSAGWSTNHMRGRTVSEQYVTDHEEFMERTGLQFESLEEQLFNWTQRQLRQGVGRSIFMEGFEEPPQPVEHPEEPEITLRPGALEAYLEEMRRTQPDYYMPVVEADRQMQARKAALLAAVSTQPRIESSSGPRMRKRTSCGKRAPRE
jgi:hypothetical protein